MTDSLRREPAGAPAQNEESEVFECNDELTQLRKDLEALVSDWLINTRFKKHPFFATPDLHFRARNLLLLKRDDSSVRTFNKYTYYVHVMVHLLIDQISSRLVSDQSVANTNDRLNASLRNANAHQLSEIAHPAYEIANAWPELLLWTPENVKKYIKERFNKEQDPQRQNILRVMGMEMQNLLKELGWDINDKDWSMSSQTS